MSDAPPDISIVLVTWNRREEMRRLLDSLDRQSVRGACEVIVVDNGSTDGTLEMLRDWPRPVVVIENGRNAGPGVARNQGVARARGHYVAFVDSDAWLVEDDVLERVAALLDAEADCCGASCFIWRDEARTQPFAKGCYMTSWGHFDPDRTWSEWDDPDYITTCFALYCRADVVAAGGFDPWYGYGIEDADLGATVKRRTGGTFAIDPERSVIHAMSTDGREHHWDAFAEKFRYLEWMRHYYVLRQFGVAAFFRNCLAQLGPGRRGRFLWEVYKMPLTRAQKWKALVGYPLAYAVMLPYLLLRRSRRWISL